MPLVLWILTVSGCHQLEGCEHLCEKFRRVPYFETNPNLPGKSKNSNYQHFWCLFRCRGLPTTYHQEGEQFYFSRCRATLQAGWLFGKNNLDTVVTSINVLQEYIIWPFCPRSVVMSDNATCLTACWNLWNLFWLSGALYCSTTQWSMVFPKEWWWVRPRNLLRSLCWPDPDTGTMFSTYFLQIQAPPFFLVRFAVLFNIQGPFPSNLRQRTILYTRNVRQSSWVPVWSFKRGILFTS